MLSLHINTESQNSLKEIEDKYNFDKVEKENKEANNYYEEVTKPYNVIVDAIRNVESDKNGNILPQKPVVPKFDDKLNVQILNEYAEDGGKAKINQEAYKEIVDTLGL